MRKYDAIMHERKRVHYHMYMCRTMTDFLSHLHACRSIDLSHLHASRSIDLSHLHASRSSTLLNAGNFGYYVIIILNAKPYFLLTLILLNTTCPVLANSVDPDQFASEEAN